MSSEPAFIEALRSIARHPAARGLDDDCAVLELGGESLILTHDAMAEGVHFRPGEDPADLAWKLVATNLSDLGAKGAEPLGVLLSYQLGQDDDRFIAGLNEVLEHYRTPLLGGDTIGSNGARVLGLTALGRATHRPVPSRAGAEPGDGLWITGPVGAAMLGFEGTGDSFAYRRPQALIAQGQALAPQVSAMMDVSDGLLLDACRMARASKATIAIESTAVPISTPESRRDEALRWGEDYQLLFTLPAEIEPNVAAKRIGTVLAPMARPLLLDGQPLDESSWLGYQHH